MAIGFESYCPLAHRLDASYAVSVRRAEALSTASFPPRLAAVAVAVQLGVPGHRGPQRTFTSRSFPGPLSLAGYSYEKASKPA